MANKSKSDKQHIAELESRLQEAEDTLEAIRNGGVDALVVKSKNEQEIFTLRSADYTYRRLIESMNQGALTINFDGTILYSNKQFSVMLGHPLERIIGNDILDFVADKEKENIKNLMLEHKRDSASLEICLLTAEGTKLTVIASVTTVTQADVKPYWCVVVTDLTERKQAEDAKDEFISLASHQLRTPATSVKQYIHMVLDGIFGEINKDQRKALERANLSNERELRIIEDLLKVAQIDAGKVILNRQPVDMVALVNEVVIELLPQITAREQTLDIQASKSPVYAFADEILIRMVIENLLDNASKYMSKKGTIRLSVTAEKDYTTVFIADEGVGMSKQDITKLYQKFTRLPNNMSVEVGGNGLGLYWVKKVIDLHKAKINVSSVLGSGTAFSVTLPRGDSGAKHSGG